MSKQSKEILLVSFLDVEPPFIGGATLPELVLLLKRYALINLLVGLVIGFLVGHFITLIVGFFLLVGTCTSVFVTAKWLKNYKRGKPPGYFLQTMAKKEAKMGIKKASFIEHEGRWY